MDLREHAVDLREAAEETGLEAFTLCLNYHTEPP